MEDLPLDGAFATGQIHSELPEFELGETGQDQVEADEMITGHHREGENRDKDDPFFRVNAHG